MALGEKLTALQGDAEITSEELTETKLSELRQEIQDCSPEGTAECVQVIENAIPRAIGEAKTKLTSLRDSVKENSTSEYSLDAFIEKVEDEKAKKMIELYQMAIGRDLETLYGAPFTKLTPEAQETAKLVFWDILQSQIGIKGVMSIGKGKMEGIGDMFRNFFGSEEEGDSGEQGSILTKHFRNEKGGVAFMKSIVDPALKEDIETSLEIVEALIGKEADNMELLLEATNTLGENEKKQIYENPLLMREVLQNGTYTANGFDIDLKSKKAIIGTEQDLKAVQSEFMTKLSQDSQGLGKTMDRMKSIADKMEGGLDGLFNIPIIGVFFKMIFGDFFKQFDVLQNKDALERLLSSLDDKPKAGSLKQLSDFTLDFIKDEDSKDTPLGKLLREKSLSPDFYRKIDPLFATLKTKGVRYGEKDFWKKILTGKSAEGNEKTIYESLKSTLGKDDLSEESLIEALNGISAESLTQETEIPKVTPGDEVPDTPINPANTDTTVSPEESPAEGGTEPQGDEAPIIAPENVQKAALTGTVGAVVASQAGEITGDNTEASVVSSVAPEVISVEKTVDIPDPRGNQISGITVPKEQTQTVKIEEAPTLESQILSATSFPINLSDGRTIAVNNDTKQLEIGDEKFQITSLVKGVNELLGFLFSVDSVEFNKLRIKATNAGIGVVAGLNSKEPDSAKKIKLINGDIVESEIKPKQMQEILLSLLDEKKYSETDRDSGITISIGLV